MDPLGISVPRYPTLGHRLPRFLSAPLFGDRDAFGIAVRPEDPEWAEWLATYMAFYEQNQKQSVGKIVNDAGYRVMRIIPLDGKRVLEVGPGAMAHQRYWNGRPAHFTLADINDDMLAASRSVLQARRVPHTTVRLERDPKGRLPFPNASFDVVISFYSLEHLHPLAPHVAEMHRVLTPGGTLAGGIPAEGGLAWGAGRFLTSRPWLRHHTRINPDKIICWEHPNFAGGVLTALDNQFGPGRHRYWPLGIPLIDVNLIVTFVYTRAGIPVPS